MDVKTAFRIFRLQENPTETDLSVSYRNLVKRFHPDNNPGKEDWAHSRMVIINNAFEMARGALASGNPASRSDADATTRNGTPRSREAEKRNRPVLNVHDLENLMLDGMYRYYQYGLENIHLRSQGSFRSHFRKSLKTLKKSIDDMERRITGHAGRYDVRKAVTILEFASCFSECIQLERYYTPAANAAHARAYRKYRNASELLDAYIRSRLFPELNSTTRRPPLGGPGLCEQDLLFVICHHHDSGWGDYSVMKLRLLEVFLAYLNIQP